MWQVLAALIALAGVLLTTNGLLGGQARVRHRLRQELELAEKMPAHLAARPVFEQYLSEALQLYVDREEQRSVSEETLRSRLRTGKVLIVLGGAVAAIPYGTYLVIQLATGGLDADLVWAFGLLSLVGLGVEYVGMVIARRASNRLDLRELQVKRRQVGDVNGSGKATHDVSAADVQDSKVTRSPPTPTAGG